MASDYNFIASALGLSGSGDVEVVSMAVVATGLIGLGLLAVGALKRANNPLVPGRSFGPRKIFEIVASFMVWLGDAAMGKENRKYLPFSATLFIFVLVMNLLGLVPGFIMPTHLPQINLGLAVLVFVLYNYWGIREVGLLSYLKHMFGPFSGWLIPVGMFLFCVELISHFIRPLSLTLRLFGNMTGDHMVLGVFTNITRGLFEQGIPVPVPVVFYLLGAVVCLIQAFVFTLLTMIYIRLATAHDESHEEEGAAH